MQASEWLVLIAAIAAIGAVNWYFFVAGRSLRGAVEAVPAVGERDGMSRVDIVVDGGYSPATVRVKAGRPVRLVFDRRDAAACSEEVVFPAFNIRKYLPTGKQTAIEVTPPAVGTYEFMCGMSMMRGALIAEA